MKNLLNSIKSSFITLRKPRTIAYAAMLIALNVIIARYLSINTQFLRIGFGFLPVAVFSMLFGPIPGAVAAALGDIIGFFIFPTGPFFPGLTLSAFIYGLIYGLFLYKKDLTLLKIIVCCFAAVFIVDLCLNTLWLSILYATEIKLIIIPRLIKAAVLFPIQVILISLYYRLVGKKIQTQIDTSI